MYDEYGQYEESERPDGGGGGSRRERYTTDQLLKKAKSWDRLMDMRWARWRREARVCFNLTSGEQWDSDDKADLIDAMRVPVVFNRAEPAIDAIMGAHLANRKEAAFYAREVGDAHVQDVLAQALKYDRDNSDAEDEEADSARDTLIAGLGWMELDLDDEDDPKGAIVWSSVDTFEMDGDPNARKKGLRDGRMLRRTRKMTPDEYREFKEDLGLMSEDEDHEMMGDTGGSDSTEDGEVTHNEPHDAYDGNDDDLAFDDVDGGGERSAYTVREYQWYEREVTEDSDWEVRDPNTGKRMVLSADKYRKLAEAFARNGGMRLSGRPRKRRCVYRMFICGSKILGGGAQRLPRVRSFTYKAITGKRDKIAKTWYGVVRALIDPQRFVNALFSQLLNIIDSSAKGGVMYEEGAIDEIREFEEGYAQVDANLKVSAGALTEGKIKPRAEMNWPQGYDRLLQFTWDSFPWVSGITPNMFGMGADAGESGVLDQQRTRQAYGVIQWFFASVRLYHKDAARLALDMMSLFDPGKLVRIVREDQAQYVEMALDSDVRRYDIVVDDAPDSPGEKERVFAMVRDLAPLLGGAQLPPAALAEFVRYAPIPAKIAETIAKEITKGPPPEQVRAMQVAQAGEEAKVAKTQSEVRLNDAKRVGELADAQKAGAETQQTAVETQLAPIEAAAKAAPKPAPGGSGQRQAAPAAASSDSDAMVERLLAAQAEQMRAFGADIRAGMEAMAGAISRPKHIVRDENNRAIGVE